MPAAENSIHIDRPRSEVFQFVADHANDIRWRSGVMDIERQSGDGRGAIFRQGVKGPLGKRIPADFEVTEYEENSRLAFRTLEGPVRPEGEYRFETDDGGTRVSLSLNATLRGPQKLMAPMVARKMRSEVGALLDLKRVLES
jgi:uncharacterized membrane protein